MTTKVAIQVDNLTSLVSKPVGPVLEPEKQPISVEQPPTASPTPLSDPTTSSSASSPSSSLGPSLASPASTSRDQESADNNNEPPKIVPLSLIIEDGPNTSSCTKKRRMGNEINPLNDSGIPMDGVELDSSEWLKNAMHLASQTDAAIKDIFGLGSTADNSSASATSSSANSFAASKNSNNEALASNCSAMGNLCDESNRSGNYSPDYPGATENHFSSEVDYRASQLLGQQPLSAQLHQQDKSTQSSGHSMHIRSFGDLFDDDDLD